MAKATTTIRQVLNYPFSHEAYFATNQSLFNRVASFYFEVIQAHEKILELGNMDALRVLEQLTHTTESNPHPVMPLNSIQEDIPAMFRRAAINATLGSARSFYANLGKWRKWKEKAEAKGKKFKERPPVPPRSWNKSATLYAGMWKERTGSNILIKVWTGSCRSWMRVRITGREIPEGFDLCSPQLVHRGGRWYLHTPVEKKIKNPIKIEKQIKTNQETRICAVDLNGNRLFERFEISFQEKPPTPLATEREEQSSGVVISQDVGCGKELSIPSTGHGDHNEHGTAQEQGLRMVEPVRDITNPLRSQSGRSYAPTARGSDYVGVSEAAGL
jgi:hypothetical protein